MGKSRVDLVFSESLDRGLEPSGSALPESTTTPQWRPSSPCLRRPTATNRRARKLGSRGTPLNWDNTIATYRMGEPRPPSRGSPILACLIHRGHRVLRSVLVSIDRWPTRTHPKELRVDASRAHPPIAHPPT